jgi:hypothetical protein
MNRPLAAGDPVVFCAIPALDLELGKYGVLVIDRIEGDEVVFEDGRRAHRSCCFENLTDLMQHTFECAGELDKAGAG